VDVQSLLRHLSEFESGIGELYGWFSQVFAADPEAEFLFYRLALEERGHVDLIEFQRRLVRKNPGSFGDVAVDFQEIVRLSERVRATRSEDPPPTLEQAVTVAFELEGSAAEYHRRTAMREANPDAARLLDSLGKADQFHLAGLREFAQRRGLPFPPA